MPIHIFGRPLPSQVYNKEENKMSSVMSPDNILGAFAVLESELPLLTGKDWQAVEKKLRILKLQIRESKKKILKNVTGWHLK
jgi:hypothetical protein